MENIQLERLNLFFMVKIIRFEGMCMFIDHVILFIHVKQSIRSLNLFFVNSRTYPVGRNGPGSDDMIVHKDAGELSQEF